MAMGDFGDFIDPYTGHVIKARTMMRYGFTLDLSKGGWTSPWIDTGQRSITSDHTNADAPVETCAHPMTLVKLTDGLATCEGCGRVFTLRDFGLPIP